jgi:hypothetical protein
MEINSYDRRQYVIALAVKNDVTPAKNTFVAFAKKIYNTKFPVSKRILKQEIDIIVSAWYCDRWNSIIEDSPYFNREETDQWKKKEH